MKKVLIITYYWPPSGGAGVQRWIKFVKYLPALGIEPLILTVHPNYATYPQIDLTLENDIPKSTKIFYAKSVDLYSFYKKVSSNKEVPYGGFANTKKNNLKEKIIRFIRGNFIIPDPRKGWNKYAVAKARELIRSHQIDTIITTSPPHSTQLIGLRLKREFDIKWIADLRDPWTDIYYFRQMYPTPIAMQIHKNLEKKVLVGADKIITVSESLKKLFAQKADNVLGKIEVISNGFDADDFKHVEINSESDFFFISYVGTISEKYDVSGLIQALSELPEDIRAKIKVRFIGRIPSNIIEEFDRAGLNKLLEVTGYVPHAKAIEFQFSSDALLLVIPDVKNNEGILTGKIFEYLASQKPILLVGPENGDAARIIRETKSGLVCDYKNHLKMKDGIIRFFQSKQLTIPEKNKLSDEVMMYTRENLTKELLTVINSL
ncbi:glycosyltransferase [Mariniphaga sediminis]|jgi:glycosyltransferase involved in cell wall biosynthesis|uniref:Glycosyltransferase n=1 Tax=Mariniphaga sediminis TaxID=1628158 RepID=A0A399CXZ1_9BACT|nr:glycosyltransferase family 4 protein [Mariniphaga sediminis]RIH64615.1 glycosyltransferase [Mariniphaga sediminis]